MQQANDFYHEALEQMGILALEPGTLILVNIDDRQVDKSVYPALSNAHVCYTALLAYFDVPHFHYPVVYLPNENSAQQAAALQLELRSNLGDNTLVVVIRD